MDILVDFIKDYKSTVGNHSDDPTAELGPVGRFMVELLKFLLVKLMMYLLKTTNKQKHL